MNAVLETIAKRSSIRAYKPEPITQEELQTILNAGLQAPTAINKQEIHFTVIKGDDPAIKLIDEAVTKAAGPDAPKRNHNFCYEAPYFIVLSALTDFGWSAIDAGIAVENMSLAAESMGLGSLIIGMAKRVYSVYDKAEGDKIMGIPEGYSFQIGLAVGYRDTEKAPHTYVAENQVSFL